MAASTHEHAHHEESFVSKYIFSQDHKMISKQFLLTAIVMGLIAMILSTLFRIQLGWPEQSSDILHAFLGDRWAPNGILDRNMYLGLVTMHAYGILAAKEITDDSGKKV